MDNEIKRPRVAIIDFGLGNLFSVNHACQHVGLDSWITSDKHEIESADAAILPGVGAFEDAIKTLKKLDLVRLLQDWAQGDKPLVGICLGFQLLMTESYEFGVHKGLNILEGTVERFENPTFRLGIGEQAQERRLPVPQIAWNGVYPANGSSWDGTLLEGVAPGENMYFVHSYRVIPADESCLLGCSQYGNIAFCSSAGRGNVFAAQFHPERSGEAGLHMYANLARQLLAR